MKCLSIKEPYSTMILEGKKTIETRTWKTNYRGEILLCCSKKPKSELSGKAFAIAELVDCREMKKEDEKDAGCEIYPKANSWVLKNIRNIVQFDIGGELGLFEREIKEEIKFIEEEEDKQKLIGHLRGVAASLERGTMPLSGAYGAMLIFLKSAGHLKLEEEHYVLGREEGGFV